VRSVKDFTRATLRQTKNPRKFVDTSFRSSLQSIAPQIAESIDVSPDFSLFHIENSGNILVVTSDEDWDLKVLVESFLQANVKTRTKYKCCVLHHCVKENKITLDPYYIVKNIIFNILRTVPTLENYFKLHESTLMNEMTKMFKSKKQT
jgi:hypothetical protein